VMEDIAYDHRLWSCR